MTCQYCKTELNDKVCFCGEKHGLSYDENTCLDCHKQKIDYSTDKSFQSKCRNCGKFFRANFHSYPFCSRTCSKEAYPQGDLLTERIIYPGYQQDFYHKTYRVKCQECGGIMVRHILDRAAPNSKWCEKCHDKLKKKVCAYCNKNFIGARISMKYCSKHCRILGKARDFRDRRRPIKPCKSCGNLFKPRDRRQFTCSIKCKSKYKVSYNRLRLDRIRLLTPCNNLTSVV